MAKLTFMDRLFLFRLNIETITVISDTFRVFHTRSKTVPIVLKFSYAGNVQYHKLTAAEARALTSELRMSPSLDNGPDSGMRKP